VQAVIDVDGYWEDTRSCLRQPPPRLSP
jgi:hypothetical protein